MASSLLAASTLRRRTTVCLSSSCSLQIYQKLTKTAPFLSIQCGSSMIERMEVPQRRVSLREETLLPVKGQWKDLNPWSKTICSSSSPQILSFPASSQNPITTKILLNKQTKTAAPYLSIQRCNTSSMAIAQEQDEKLRSMAIAVEQDEKLRMDISSEIEKFIESEEQMLSPQERAALLEEEKFPYEVIYNPGDMTITLNRKLPSGENIRIITRDWEKWENWANDKYRNPHHILLDVVIDKGEGHTLNFKCSFHRGGNCCIKSITLKRTVDAEDEEAYHEELLGMHVEMALMKYLKVRGMNHYLFDFFCEYMKEEDKTAGRLMLKRDKRASAAAEDVVRAADDELKRYLELDVQIIEQIESPDEVHELPEDFPFQIIDIHGFDSNGIDGHGLAVMILKRELACENIEVTVFHDDNLEIRTFNIVVMVNRKKGLSLRFDCKINRNGLEIESIKRSDKAEGKARQWHQLSVTRFGLDMHKYLEMKDINGALFYFIDEYIDKKQSRGFWQDAKNNFDTASEDGTPITVSLKAHAVWLKTLREFLEK